MLKLPRKTGLVIWFIGEESMARITEEHVNFQKKGKESRPATDSYSP